MAHCSSSVVDGTVEWMVLDPKLPRSCNRGGLEGKHGGHCKEERVHWVESTHSLIGVLNKGVAQSSCSCSQDTVERREVSAVNKGVEQSSCSCNQNTVGG